MPATHHRAESAFDVVVHDAGTTRTVTPIGEIDLATVPRVREPLLDGLSQGFETVVLDLGETTFLDSSGIKLLFEVIRESKTKRVGLVLLPGSAAVKQTFDQCGLSNIVQFATGAHPSDVAAV